MPARALPRRPQELFSFEQELSTFSIFSLFYYLVLVISVLRGDEPVYSGGCNRMVQCLVPCKMFLRRNRGSLK
jgi:hypothetical protein